MSFPTLSLTSDTSRTANNFISTTTKDIDAEPSHIEILDRSHVERNRKPRGVVPKSACNMGPAGSQTSKLPVARGEHSARFLVTTANVDRSTILQAAKHTSSTWRQSQAKRKRLRNSCATSTMAWRRSLGLGRGSEHVTRRAPSAYLRRSRTLRLVMTTTADQVD